MPEYVLYPTERIVVADTVSPPSPDAIATVATSLLMLGKVQTDFPEPMRQWHMLEEECMVSGQLRRLIAQAFCAYDPTNNNYPIDRAQRITERCLSDMPPPAAIDIDTATTLLRIASILEQENVPHLGPMIRNIAERMIKSKKC